MHIDNFLKQSVRKIIEGYTEKHISPRDIAQICIERIEKYNPVCEAFENFSPEKLLSDASISENRLAKGSPVRLLEGIPVGIKDIFNTIDFPTQMGSPIWQNFQAGNDARVVYNLKQTGAAIPGKTVTAEFAVHALGKTRNPHAPDHTPGTSSSGSAVAVATGMVPVALGTQTAGSIVRPASFCGIYGCKPSFGLIPRTGTLKTTDSLDTIGFFTTFLEDVERVFDAIRVKGLDYPISHRLLNDPKRQTKPDDRPWRIAFVKTSTWQHAPDYAKSSLLEWVQRISKDSNFDVIEAELPENIAQAHEVHQTIYDCTLAYYFKEEYKNQELVSPIMNRIIKQGQRVTPEQYQTALIHQEGLAATMDDFLKNFDALISLSTAGEAPLREEQELPDPALIWTLTHLPVISAPAFTSPSGLPFGAQLVARRYNDRLLFRLAEHLCKLGFIPPASSPGFADM